MKLTYNEALSNFGFHVKLRRYTKAKRAAISKVWRCSLKPVETSIESAWYQRLKPKDVELGSKFAYDFKLRRYTKVWRSVAWPEPPHPEDAFHAVLGEIGRAWRILLATS